MDETIMLEAYRLIRIKAREFNGSSDEILGAYTRGVVDLQSELYKKNEDKAEGEGKEVRAKIFEATEIDFDDTHDGYTCHSCNMWVKDKTDYCPNCGTKMVEPQKSEVGK